MATGFETFLIIFSCVVVLLLIAVNSYILYLYLHPDDKPIKRTPYGKITIILGLTLSQCQALLVPLDITLQANIDSQTFSMSTLWQFLYVALLVFICILIPLAIFFYESDAQHTIPQRLMRAFGYLIVVLTISCMLLFISWNFLTYVDLPFTQIQQVYQDVPYVNFDTQREKDLILQSIQASLAVYIIAILSFIGWFFVVFFGGVGLFALPIDMINEFRFRPKVRKSQEMMRTKEKLIAHIKQLIEQGEQIKQFTTNFQRNQQQQSCFQKFKGRRQSNTKFTKFKVKYHLLDQHFQIFNLQLQLSSSNPIIPYLKLLLGILFLITSLLWIIQIIFGHIAKKYLSTHALIPFMNQLFIGLQEKGVGLLSTILYCYMCLYFMWCVQKGSIKLGMRLPLCCRFYPMVENQTAMNGFLVNVLLLILASIGVTQLCVSSFPTYTRFAQANSIFQVEIKYMRFYNYIFEKSIFPIALICWTLLTLLYLLVSCNRVPKYMQAIDNIRKEEEEEIEKLTS